MDESGNLRPNTPMKPGMDQNMQQNNASSSRSAPPNAEPRSRAGSPDELQQQLAAEQLAAAQVEKDRAAQDRRHRRSGTAPKWDLLAKTRSAPCAELAAEHRPLREEGATSEMADTATRASQDGGREAGRAPT